MIRFRLILLAATTALLTPSLARAQQLVVTGNNNADQLAEALLGTTATISTSSLDIINDGVSGDPSTGTFSDASGIFLNPDDTVRSTSGILLTTGSASGAGGPNDETGFTAINNVLSTAFTIDFSFAKDTRLGLDFVVGSEEWNTDGGSIDQEYPDKLSWSITGPDFSTIGGGGFDTSGTCSRLVSTSDPSPPDTQYNCLVEAFSQDILLQAKLNYTLQVQIIESLNSADSGVFLVADIKPVPAPLPFLGSAAAFAYSRRLRRRLRKAVPEA